MGLNTNFSVSLNVNADMSNFQKSLDRIAQNKKIKLKVDLDTAQIQKQINSLNNLNNSPLKQGFERINTTIKNNVSLLDKSGKLVKNATVVTERWKNSFGDIEDRLVFFNEKMKNIGTQTVKVANGIKNISTTTNEFQKTVNGVTQNVTQVTKKITDTSGATKTLVTETSKFVDQNNMLHTVTENYEEVNGAMQKVGASTEVVTKNVEKQSEKVKTLGQSFADTIKKVAKFYLATIPIQAVQKAITESVTVIKEYDDAITEMKKVTDLSGQSLKEYTQTLSEFGSEVGRTTTVMTELATGFLKAGYDEDTASELAKIAA